MSKKKLKSIPSDLTKNTDAQEEIDHDDTYNDDESMISDNCQIDGSLGDDTMNDEDLMFSDSSLFENTQEELLVDFADQSLTSYKSLASGLSQSSDPSQSSYESLASDPSLGDDTLVGDESLSVSVNASSIDSIFIDDDTLTGDEPIGSLQTDEEIESINIDHDEDHQAYKS